MTVPAEPARCEKHGLALTGAGGCALCRRPPGSSRRGLAAIASLVILGAAGTIVAHAVRTARNAPPPVTAMDEPAPLTGSAEGAASPEREGDGDDDEAAFRDALRQVPITMYATSWCPVCARARRFFAANGIPFTEKDVERDADARRAHRRLNRAGSVPTIDVDGQVLIGFAPRRVAGAIERAVGRRLGR